MASEPWSHHFDEEEWKKRVDDLAKELYAAPATFALELPWLNSGEAKAAPEVGHFFGKLDAPSLRFLNQIIDAAVERKADGFARGYVYGITEHPQHDLSQLNQALDRVQEAEPKLAFYIMLPAGDSVRSFDRALGMMADRKNSRTAVVESSSLGGEPENNTARGGPSDTCVAFHRAIR